MSETADILLRVTPGAAREGLGGIWEGPGGERRLVLRVTVPPEKGKANKAVIAFLAKKIGVPKSALSLVSGETDRNKMVRLEAIGAAAAIAQLFSEAG